MTANPSKQFTIGICQYSMIHTENTYYHYKIEFRKITSKWETVKCSWNSISWISKTVTTTGLARMWHISRGNWGQCRLTGGLMLVLVGVIPILHQPAFSQHWRQFPCQTCHMRTKPVAMSLPEMWFRSPTPSQIPSQCVSFWTSSWSGIDSHQCRNCPVLLSWYFLRTSSSIRVSFSADQGSHKRELILRRRRQTSFENRSVRPPPETLSLVDSCISISISLMSASSETEFLRIWRNTPTRLTVLFNPWGM